MNVPDLKPFLIVPKRRGDAAPLLDFMKIAAEEYQGSVIVDRAVGTASTPTRLVVRATGEAIGALKNRYGGALHIEPDLGLKMTS